MTGATITLKNVPPQIHQSLKESAKRHKRSLNQEAIYFLEAALLQERGERPSLLDAPAPIRVGRILVPRKELIARATDMLDRNS